MTDIDLIPLSKASALRLVRDLADDSDRIIVLRPGCSRLWQRQVTRKQIEACLRKGSIVEGPFQNAQGHWQVSLFRQAAGEKLTCVAAIDSPGRRLMITAY